MSNCVLKDTEYCTTLGRKSCEECDIAKMPKDVQEKVRSDIDLVRSLLPEEGISPLYESQTCLFCRDEPPRKRDCYATTDMGHVEPRGTKPSIIGIKVKTKVGSMIPLQIACCNRCKRAHTLNDLLPILCTGGALVLCLLVISIDSVGRALAQINEVASLVTLAASLLVGYAAGKIIAFAFKKRLSRHVKFDIEEIDLIRKMESLGWFPIGNDGKARLIFSKERLKKGWFV